MKYITNILSYLLISTLFIILSSCSWEPSHDNPSDPHYPPYQAFGSLQLAIKTRFDAQPIVNATVLLTLEGEEGRFGVTDSSGIIDFNELPEGVWEVETFRENSEEIIYGRDTIRVSIAQGIPVDTFMQLNALPIFTATRVNSITQQFEANTDSVKSFIRLTAQVHDPDGAADIKRVEWKLLDIMQGELTFQQVPDSSYWWAEISSEAFESRSIVDAISLPFNFTAVDEIESYSFSEPTSFHRVINGIIRLEGSSFDPQPILDWYYSEVSFEFQDSTQFHYRIRIIQIENFPPTLVYDTLLTPTSNRASNHMVAKPLSSGRHTWEIWVEDNFLNSSRPWPSDMTVP